MQQVKNLGEGLSYVLRAVTSNTEEEAQKITDAVEKMLDTTSGSNERKQAKQELVNALIREP